MPHAACFFVHVQPSDYTKAFNSQLITFLQRKLELHDFLCPADKKGQLQAFYFHKLNRNSVLMINLSSRAFIFQGTDLFISSSRIKGTCGEIKKHLKAQDRKS